jgi:excinuclease ABC subunit A
MEEKLVVRGAREHNLRGIDVAIPRNKLTVITGLSGSGKSSLAFDTIFAEGQRRYVESLSAYARQFLGLMEKPDVDAIEGLSPAIAIEQKSAGSQPALHRGHGHGDLRLPAAALRPLSARPHTARSAAVAVRAAERRRRLPMWCISVAPQGTRIEVFAPLVRGRKGEFRELFEDARKQGFVRVLRGRPVGGAGQSPPTLNRYGRTTMCRSSSTASSSAGWSDRTAAWPTRIETALCAGRTAWPRWWSTTAELKSHLFSEKYGCVQCGISACPSWSLATSRSTRRSAPATACAGLGTRREVSRRTLILGDPSITILEGVVLPWGEPDGLPAPQHPAGAGKEHYGFELEHAPWGEAAAKPCSRASCAATAPKKVKFPYRTGGKAGVRRTVGGHPLQRACAATRRRQSDGGARRSWRSTWSTSAVHGTCGGQAPQGAEPRWP